MNVLAAAVQQWSWRRHGTLTIGAVIVLAVVAAAAGADLLAPYSPYDLDVARMLETPSPAHWLGTDEVGRDVLSRTIHAARISVEVALVAVGVGLVGGTLIGLVAAYFGGIADTHPHAPDGAALFLSRHPARRHSHGEPRHEHTQRHDRHRLIFIPGFARLARATTMEVLRQQYVDAARAVGMGDLRIIFREILPNILAPSLVEAAVAFAYAVLLESALSFLGLGAQPPEPSWGNMINTGRGFMAQAPWLGIVPGMALFFCVLGFNLLGDGLRDVLDPHLKD